MNRTILAMVVLGVGAGTAPAQPVDGPASFKFTSVELRKAGERWQIVADGTVLKDFGSRQDDARTALRIIRDLRLNQLCTIGAPQPVFEYWLADGRAPAAVGRLPVRSFDPQKLKVEENQGQWLLRDASQPVLSLGTSRLDAEQALAVLQRHGFNRVGTIGQQGPVMMYFLAVEGDVPKPPPSKPPQAGTARPGLPAVPRLGSDQPLVPGAQAEGRKRLDWRHIEVRQDGADWKLVNGEETLAVFGTEAEAREAQRVLQQLRCTDHCQIGDPARPFTYFLINDQPPRNLPLGFHYQSFRPDELGVKGSGADWFVCGREGPLFRAGSTFSEAWRVVQTLKKYRFDHLCWIGNADDPAFRFPVRVR